MKPSRARLGNDHGFTLLEMIVVMVLIAIVSGFTLPRIHSSLLADHLRSTARRIAGMATTVSQEAMRRHSPALLHIDLEKGRLWYELESGDDEEGRAKSSMDIPESVRVTEVASRHGGAASLGDLAIRFSAKGYVDETLVRLRDEDDREATVVLSPFLGVVRVLDGRADFRE